MTPTSALQVWLPPMLTLLGTLVFVLFGVVFTYQLVEAKIDALRAEMKQGFAEIRLEFHSARRSPSRIG